MPAGGWVTGFRHMPTGRHHDEDPKRDVDQEDRTPRHGPDQVAAKQRPKRSGNTTQSRPGADRAGAVAGTKTRLDHRQAAGSEKRPADALKEPRGDEQFDVGGDRAQQRGEREQANPEYEYPAASMAIAKRAAEQDQRGQRQQVAVEDPLQRAGRRAKVAADVGQGHIDHRSIKERQARALDGLAVGRITAEESLEHAICRCGGNPGAAV